jgi:flagellar hook assembly protein FlgD
LAVKSPKAFGVGEASERDATDEMNKSPYPLYKGGFNDNQYHAGETVKLIVEVAKAETGLKGTISIRSSKATYDSGVQRLKDEGHESLNGAGNYSYLWETKGLKEADDYVVEATVKDLASNQTTDTSLAITIDNTPPASGTLVIDTVESRGSIGHLPTETKMRTITLKITAEDSVQMWIEGDLVDDTNTFEWIPFQSELVVNLTPGDGEKVIKVRHQDAAGNEGRVAEATLFLNEYPPVIQSVDSEDKDNPTDADEIYHAGQPIVIIIKSAEAETGLKAMVQIKSEINAYDSGIKIALPTSDFQLPTSEGEGSYSYLWDTSGLKSAADYVVKVTLQDTLGQKAVDESLLSPFPKGGRGILTITIDNEPPTGGKLTINNEDEFTNERRVLLELRITNYEVRSTKYEVRIEGDVVEDAATYKWIPKGEGEGLETKEVQLTEGDGKKTVRVQFRDEALNDSLPVEDSITLDTTAPTNTRIVINAGEIETDSRAVTLNVLAEEATEMYIDGDVTESVADETTRNNTFRWIPYQSVKQVELTEGDGKKWVGIKYRDDAGNESIRIESSIILDQPGPTLPSIVINGGETYTNSPTVSLRLSAEGATEMYVDGDIVPSASTFRWIPYGNSELGIRNAELKESSLIPKSEIRNPNSSVELQVNLIKSDGKKRVRARFRNGAGNESEQVESSITLDQTAPVIEVVESYDANNPSDNDGIYHPGQVVLIKTTAKKGETRLDGTIRIKSEEVKYDTGTQKLTDRGDGSYTYIWQTVDLQDAKDYIVKITLEDAVAFTAVDNSLLITLDSTPPLEPSVIIEGELPHVGGDGGGTISRSRSVKLAFSAGAEDVMEMFIEGDIINDTNTFQWIPYAAEIVVNVVGNDGEKNIKVKFRDAAMNESEDAEIKVTLELKRPQLLAYVYLLQPDGQKIAYLVLPFDELISNVSQEDFYVNLSNPDKLEEQLELVFGAQTFSNNPLTPFGKGESLDATEVEPEDGFTGVNPVVAENKVVVQLTEEQVQILSSWQVTGGTTSGPIPPKTGSLPDGIWVQIAENSAFDLVGNGNLGNQRKPSIVRLTRPSFLQQALVEPQEFSPNGDGVKDEAVILYALRNDSNVTVKIENWRQYPIYQWEQTTQLKDMTSELKWDGKKQDGSACTDGTYTISIEIIDSLTGVPVVAKTFSVILDNTPPQITSKEPLPGGQIPPTPEIAVEVVDTSENQAASGIDEQNIYVMFDPKAFGVGEASEHNPEQAILLTPPSPSDDGGGKGKYTIPSGRFILNSGQHSVTFHVADKAGNYTEETVEYTVVGTGESPLLKLMNYPNPFKPGGSTTILYVLSDAVKSAVMSIYDAGGNLVLLKQLKGEELESGEHRIEWDGTDIFGEWLARGVYFCEFRIVTKNPGNTAQKRLHKIAVW